MIKKLSAGVFLFAAIASFGVKMSHAYADTLTPAEAATIQTSIDGLKAKLLQLQSQEAVQKSAPQASNSIAASPTTAVSPLSADDARSLSRALGALSAMLMSLQGQLSQNPQLVTHNAQDLLLTLHGMSNTIAMINSITVGIASAPIARKVRQSAMAEGTLTPQSGNPTVAEAPSVQAVPVSQDANTAQVSSAWSRMKADWQYYAVGLVVIALGLLWYFWPEGKEEKKKIRKNNSETPEILHS